MPTVSFFLSTTDHPIDEDHPLWSRPLPDNRRPGVVIPEGVETITYGKYFSAVAQFCAADGWNRVLKAASQKLAQPVALRDLTCLSVFLEKHGAFYHPARLRMAVKDQTLYFVVNVATSNNGRQTLSREVKALEHLNDQRPFDWFPRVYDCVSDNLPMYLGDWFDGFHEFHLTRQPDSDKCAIVVWDGAAERRLLSAKQTADLYRQATMILAACYDPSTSCQIFPWHHAAGDFVVRVDDERMTVKLISVRNYVRLTGTKAEPDNERALLDALVVFFIHLSVRMRLDRIDGVSAVVWAPDGCLAPIVEGFFQGLDLTARMNGLPEAFPEAFRHYCNHHDATDLLAMAGRITETIFDERSEERRVIDGNLTNHIDDICRILSAG